MKLTENQALVYRALYAEELEYDGDEERAARETLAFWSEHVAPDWHGWWRAWNRKDQTPFEFLIEATMGIAVMAILAKHGERLIGQQADSVANALRILTAA